MNAFRRGRSEVVLGTEIAFLEAIQTQETKIGGDDERQAVGVAKLPPIDAGDLQSTYMAHFRRVSCRCANWKTAKHQFVRHGLGSYGSHCIPGDGRSAVPFFSAVKGGILISPRRRSLMPSVRPRSSVSDSPGFQWTEARCEV
jgi:hypothetical protein